MMGHNANGPVWFPQRLGPADVEVEHRVGTLVDVRRSSTGRTGYEGWPPPTIAAMLLQWRTGGMQSTFEARERRFRVTEVRN